MKKLYILFLLFGVLITLSAYALNTIVHIVPGGQNSEVGAYPSQVVQTLTGSLTFMNLDNDEQKIGDYFTGYYYDAAYGIFSVSTGSVSGSTNRVRIKETVSGRCPNTHNGYKLTGYAFNPEFGFTNFEYNASTYVYMCIPNTAGQLGNTLRSYLAGYSYSPLIGFQNFEGIQVQSSVVFGESSLTQGARQIKIIGLASSQISSETRQGQFMQDVKLVGKSSKPELRKKIQQNVSIATRGLSNPAISGSITNLSGEDTWQNTVDGSVILNGEGRYFAPNSGEDIALSGDNLEGNKTLVVEGGNIYITGNITGNGILGLIALEKNGQGGNIYIHPSVTDIYAVMYADRSVISYNGAELDGTTQDSVLANQLYIKGSLFSENTLGGFELRKCPFYLSATDCTTSQQAAKYDLNYLRRYILVTEVDEFGTSTKYPQFNANQSFAGGTIRGSRNAEFQEYAVVIEYDSRVQQDTPSLFR